MTRDVESVRSTDKVQLAAEKMKTLNVGAIPVIDGEKAVGILTDRDIILRAVAERLDPMRTQVADVMTRDVISCDQDTDVENATWMMEGKQVRRLLVEDSRGQVVGIVSLGDLARNAGKAMAGQVLEKASAPGKSKR
jgi:CBS domain-containing protein